MGRNMLKILNFLKFDKSGANVPSMRARFDALQEELNAVLQELPEMPAVSIDPAARQIHLSTPEQFADEALALPAPSPSKDAEGTVVENSAGSPEAGTEVQPEAEKKAG